MNQYFGQLVENLWDFKYNKLDFDELKDEKQNEIGRMVKIVKKEVIDIADKVDLIREDVQTLKSMIGNKGSSSLQNSQIGR